MESDRFPNLIRRMRERRGLRSFELANAIGRPQSFISNLETGKIRETPQPDVLIALSRELGISVAEQLTALGYPIEVAEDPAAAAQWSDLIRAMAALTPKHQQLIRELVDSLARDKEYRSG